MRVGAILVVHSIYPEKLLASMEHSRYDVQWYIFFHGKNVELKAKIDALVIQKNAVYFPFMMNRGLARSWNDGIIASKERGDDVTLLLNDDLYFLNGGFDLFVDFILNSDPSYGLAFLVGREIGRSALAGQTIVQGFACCGIGNSALERIGYFDENFRPAYFEDTDYYLRAIMMALPMIVDLRVLVEHERSSTQRADPEIEANFSAIQQKLAAYYLKKWGGLAKHEIYGLPFNNSAFTLRIDKENRASPYGKEFDNLDEAM